MALLVMALLCKHEALHSKMHIKNVGIVADICLMLGRWMQTAPGTNCPVNQNERTPGIMKNPVSKEIRWKVIEEDTLLSASDFHMYSTLCAT